MSSGAAPVLIGDLGGTRARLALAHPGREPSDVRVLATADFPDPATAIAHYLADIAGPRPRRARLAIATPVLGDRLRMTNAGWDFSVEQTRRRLAFDDLRFINDFAAQALALPYLGPADQRWLGGGPPRAGMPMLALGPGTGLGVAALVSAGGGWTVVQGEGGHASYSPMNEREWAVVRAVTGIHGHCSAERLLSGPGLALLCQTLGRLDGRPATAVAPEQVVAAAPRDAACAEALDLFSAGLGGFAGDLALAFGALGGVYLCGGVLPRLGERFDADAFRARFEAKGRFGDYLRRVATFMVLHPQPGLLGLSRDPGTYAGGP